jgi:hypothetical protein
MPTVQIWKNHEETLSVPLNDQGIIDDSAKMAFRHGQCHALALAIKQLKPDWQLIALGDGRNRLPYDPGHILVKTDDGNYIDIEGRGAVERWKTRFGVANLFPLTEDEVFDRLETYLEPAVEIAMPFATTLLKSEGYEV